MKKKYVGVTGFSRIQDVAIVDACIPLLPPGWRLMAGVLVSEKTLLIGHVDNPRYPSFATAQDLWLSLRKTSAWPVVHFNTRAKGDVLLAQLKQLCIDFPDLRGIQLNLVKPDPGVVKAFAQEHREVEIILQVNGSSVERKASSIHEYVKKYEGFASHALLDLSGGRGVPLDRKLAQEVISGWDSSAEIAVAGGLCAETAHLLEGLGVSCDAETRLRNEKNELDPESVLAYVRTVSGLLSS